MAAWIQRRYGKGEIDRAADILVPWWMANEDLMEVDQQRVNNRKSSRIGVHRTPCRCWPSDGAHFAHETRCPEWVIAQRLKRISSVLNKLAREPRMKLSQMQDLGGCRAIVPDVASVDQIFNLYRGPEDLFTRESTAIVPHTPTDASELTRELRELTKALRVRQRLAGWSRALRKLAKARGSR